MAGLRLQPQTTQEELFKYLKETRQKIDQLPYIYQRLFEIGPLTDERLFAGREEELALLKGTLAPGKRVALCRRLSWENMAAGTRHY